MVKNLFLTNISYGLIGKILNVILSIILIRVLVDTLGRFEYGLWMAIFSFMGWFSILDFGLGNTLKYKLIKLIASKNFKEAKKEVLTMYLLIIIVATILFFLLQGIIELIILSNLLDIGNLDIKIYRQVLFFTSLFFCINLVLNTFYSFYFASGKPYINEIAMCTVSFINIVLLMFFNQIFNINILFVSILLGAVQMLVAIIYSLYFYLRNFLSIKSNEILPKSLWLERLKMGGNFFIIQIGIVIIFSTDNVLVSNLISSAEVTEYSSITRVVVTFLSIWYLVINPASYRVSEYLEKNDYNKLKGLILKLNKSLVLISIGLITLSFFLNDILSFWLGYEIVLPYGLAIISVITIIIRMQGEIFSSTLNVIEKIKFQAKIVLLAALINIPLSIFFVNNIFNSSTGVIMGSLCSVAFITVALNIYFWKVLKNLENQNEI